MKKLFAMLPMIGLALGIVAIATGANTTTPIFHGQQLSGFVVDCIKTALEKRENAVVSAVTSFQTNSITALTDRKDSLLVAWDETTKADVRSAISSARKTYKDAMSALKDTKSDAKKTAWSTYNIDVKSCRGESVVSSVDLSSINSEQ